MTEKGKNYLNLLTELKSFCKRIICQSRWSFCVICLNGLYVSLILAGLPSVGDDIVIFAMLNFEVGEAIDRLFLSVGRCVA